MSGHYCEEHQYTPPENSGFLLCPECETGVQKKTRGIITVSLKVELPIDTATQAQIDEWLSYCLFESVEISGENPLADHDLEAFYDSIEWG
jgi:hypothetical protein